METLSTHNSEERARSGFTVAIGVVRSIMRIQGIWPGFSTPKVGLSRYAFLPATIISILFTIGPQTAQMFQVGNDLNAILRILTTSNVPNGIALFKLLGVSFHHNVLHQLIVSASKDWKKATKQSELDIMWQKARMSRMFSLICIILAEGSVVSYAVLMISGICTKNWSSKPLFMTGKFPYDAQISPSYEATWILQIVALVLLAGAFSSVDALFITLALHLCGQLNNLQISIREIGQSNCVNELQFLRTLSKLVNKHRKISEFASAIEDSFNLMFLVQMMASAMTLILQGYQLVMITTSGGSGTSLFELIFMIYFTLCFTFSLFMYCYVAEVLRNESMEVGNAAYECNWYNLPPAKTKFLILIMIRAKQPFILTAGKFTAFSLQLFCSIMKSSGSYLSVLLAMRDRLV